MSWFDPAPSRLGFACAFGLGALFSLSNTAQAVEATSLLRLSQAAPAFETVRHHLRKHRRGRLRPEKASEPEETSAKPELPQPPKEKESPSTGVKEGGALNSTEPYGPPPPPVTWSPAEVEAGRLDCNRRLSGLHVIFERLPPIREGACGLPSPIRLKGFESERAPVLYFDPPPTISCKMTEALRRWFDDVVQPKAKAYLHATIVSISTLSGYDCRTRYDDPTQRISQHAYANAIDLSEFITAKGERVAVSEAWNAGDERAAFLRGIHGGACEIFGTALGPEANEAHQNHFHLDMIARRHPLCDFTPAQARAREEAKRHALPPASTVKVPVSGGESAIAQPSKSAARPEHDIKADESNTPSEQGWHRRHRRRFRHTVRF